MLWCHAGALYLSWAQRIRHRPPRVIATSSERAWVLCACNLQQLKPRHCRYARTRNASTCGSSVGVSKGCVAEAKTSSSKNPSESTTAPGVDVVILGEFGEPEPHLLQSWLRRKVSAGQRHGRPGPKRLHPLMWSLLH